MTKIFAVLLMLSVVGSVFAQNQVDNSSRAKTFIDALGVKDFAAAYNFFTDEIKTQLPVEAMPQIWQQNTGQFGRFKSQRKITKTAIPTGEKISTICEFEKGSIAISTAFDKNGKIQGFFFEDSQASGDEPLEYKTPKYADIDSFTETETTVGAGEWTLPATLTMPKGKTNVPAIVLVHGSGPNDRDETLGGNKVFKDLAWGLASRGIAVLRYEKRTRQYGAKLAAVKNFTVKEETVDDAVLAAQLLMRTPNVNARKVFVLGHSLGGYLIPRIGERDETIAGFISLAGATRPLEDVIPEQYAYIFGLDGAIAPAEQTQIDEVKKVSAKIKSLKEADRASGEFYFGAFAPYYLDLQNYDPPKVAVKLKQPMLILQGESDYQVTMKDFANWKNALGARKNVAFKSYPKLTHIFMETTGDKPSPKDYEKVAHVNAQVVGDIADWILKTAK